MAQLPPEIERELMELVFRHRDPLLSLDNLLRPYVDLMLRYGAAQAAAERERAAEIAREHQRWNTKEGSEGWNIAGAIASDIVGP